MNHQGGTFRDGWSIRSIAALGIVMLCGFQGCGRSGPVPPRALEEGGTLWRIEDGGGSRTELAGDGFYGGARGAGAIYYAFFEIETDGAPLRVLQCSADGTIVASRLLVRDGWEAANAILRVTWLRGNRVFVDTHVNPSLGFGVEIDLDSGASNVYAGTTFAWDTDARRVAFLCEPPHFGSPPDAPSKLLVGHEEICDVPRRLRSELFWNARGDALTAFIPPEDGRPGELVLVTFPDNAPRRVERFDLQAAKEPP